MQLPPLQRLLPPLRSKAPAAADQPPSGGFFIANPPTIKAMSLVTRCTACGTLFKVVVDQLKISDGWVRCGQCGHVFDARANLVEAGVTPTPAVAAPVQTRVDLPIATKSIARGADSMPARGIKTFENSPVKTDIDALQDWQPSASPAPEERREAALQSQPTAPANFEDMLRRPETGLPSSYAGGFEGTPVAPASVQQRESRLSLSLDSRVFQPGLLRDSGQIDSEAGPSTASWANSDYASQHPAIVGVAQGRSISLSAEPTTLDGSGVSTPQPISLPSEQQEINTSDPSTQPLPTPGFVKQAQRAARWRSPWVRAGLCLVALVLLAALALQVALYDKDRLAATYPQTKPWLEQLCTHAGCRVEALKRIESIVIDSSSFNRINKNNPQLEASTQSYKLGITLKNTGHLAVALPHVELSLQDTQDQPIVRRVLSPADLGASLDRLQPAQELAGTLTLQIPTSQLAGSRINGYRVLAFYP
jgi:predicted Zn finger-like uncharacterized protein